MDQNLIAIIITITYLLGCFLFLCIYYSKKESSKETSAKNIKNIKCPINSDYKTFYNT